MRPLLAAFCLCIAATASHAQAPLRFFTVGSGDIGGGYYAVASALCQALNRGARGVMRCSPDPTAGSLYNLAMLDAGELDFAFAQSDWQRSAFDGGGPLADGVPMSGLRSVMSLYPEMITIIARRNSGIGRSEDLFGKRIDIGQPGSGRNASLTRLLAVLGLGRADFEALVETPVATAFDELCAGRIDATLMVIGHPNATVARVLEECDAVLVPFVGSPQVAEVLETVMGLQRAVIPGGTYSGVDRDIPTQAVTATIVTRANTDPALVQSFVAAALADLPKLAVHVPVLAGLTPETMRSVGLTAPLHPGAEAAFDAAAGN